MVTQVGGGIHVISRESVGTIFQIFLPRVHDAVRAVRGVEAMVVDAGKRKVLIVDDDHNVRGLIVRVLQLSGYDVNQADSAEQVLNNPQLGDVDLIISDVVMPGLSGPEFSEQWLRTYPSAQFLFISGYVENDSQIGILMAGNFLAKPFRPAALIAKVQSILAV